MAIELPLPVPEAEIQAERLPRPGDRCLKTQADVPREMIQVSRETSVMKVSTKGRPSGLA